MKKIIIFLCLFGMAFIFYMSSNNGEISHQESNKVVNLIESTKEILPNEAESKPINKNTIDMQQAKENELDYIIRKNAHAFMYMILSFLVSSLFFAFNKRGKTAIVYILFISLFYAVIDEFHQSFVLGRTSLVSDVLIDFGGALIGVILFYLAYYKTYEKYAIKKKASLNI